MKAKNLLDWQPEATDIRYVGKCPDCQENALLFYSLLEHDERIYVEDHGKLKNSAMIKGGFFCEHCGFGASGAMQKLFYDAAPNIERKIKS